MEIGDIMNLSKSRYCVGIRCQKELWLSCYKEEVAKEQDNDVIIENGNKVGEFARGLFGNYILIENNDNKEKMIQETKKYLAKKPNIICEASFSYLNNFCSLRYFPTPETVPPVPTPATKTSIFPSISFQISLAVVS